ncbi:4974_t:CDS:2 [Diversispora eburnea]|uniref:4974_t:CDS:1 n=1 Tax=Diversispora eburnea TaxID=1213867 RepID=A0A9N8YU76_9GLOM|nr:4974_t:CDS:2 [Diversispora eburnea]
MGKRSPAFSIKIPENNFFFNHISKKSSITLPKLLLCESPVSPPTKSDEEFEIELDRSRNEFNQFNKDLDEKQDNVEECIMATQEKIFENEVRLSKLQFFHNEAHEEVNNDLKRIQEQIYEILDKHRCSRSNVTNLCNNQTRTTEQLDYMLQAIQEYARLIEEASLTIKHFGDVGSPIKYESLDLSPFRQFEGSISYFDDQIHNSTHSTHSTHGVSPVTKSSESLESPSASSSTTNTAATTPTSFITDSSEFSPLSPEDQSPNKPIHPLPRYQIKHQKLLLLSMRRAAVGLKFLLYANKLNDYKNDCPDSDCDLDLGLYDDSLTEEVVTTTYKDVIVPKKSGDVDVNCKSSSESNNTPGNICVTIRKRSHIVHSYDLLRFDKRMLVKQQG